MQKRIINAIIIIVCFITCLSSILYTSWCYKQDIYNSNLSYVQNNYSCVAGINNELAKVLNDCSNINVTEIVKEITIQSVANANTEEIEIITENEIVETETPTYNNDDYELLAHLVWSEGGVLGYTNMMYTGSVVLNRVNDIRFPNNIYDVIYQEGQYAVSWNGNLWGKTPNEEAYQVADELLVNGSVLPNNVLGQSNFVQMDGVYITMGDGGYKTYYCYLN